MGLTAKIIAELQKHANDIDLMSHAQSIRLIVKMDRRTGKPVKVFAQPDFEYEVHEIV